MKTAGTDPAVRACSRGRLPVLADRVLGTAASVAAGVLFVLVCGLAGFLVLVARGVDVPRAPGLAEADIALATRVWWPSLLTAVAGLVLWIRAGVRGTPILPWAAADLLVQTVAFGVLLPAAAGRG